MMMLLAVAAIAGGACADEDEDDASAPAATPRTGAAVTIDTFRFDPDPLTVERGQAVTWTNNDAITHTATDADGAFDLTLPDKGTTATHTFGTAGTFAYTCTRHPGMAGTVIVR